MFGKRAKLGNRIDEDCVCLLTKEEVEGEGVFVFSFFFKLESPKGEPKIGLQI